MKSELDFTGYHSGSDQALHNRRLGAHLVLDPRLLRAAEIAGNE